jgi:hypothetical protein
MSKIIGRSKKAVNSTSAYMLLAKETSSPRIAKAAYYLSAFMKRKILRCTMDLLKNINLQYS